MVSLYYDSLMRHQSDVPLRVVEIILSQREDIDKKQFKEAIESCRLLLENKKTAPPAADTAPKDSMVTHTHTHTKIIMQHSPTHTN